MKPLFQSENYLNNQLFGLYEPKKWLNMVTQKQLKIFEVFAKKPFAEYTRKEVKKESKEKSNNALALTINLLKTENVLIEKKIGKSGLLNLNLENDLTFYYLALCNNNRIARNVKSTLELLKKKFLKKLLFIQLLYSALTLPENKKKTLTWMSQFLSIMKIKESK